MKGLLTVAIGALVVLAATQAANAWIVVDDFSTVTPTANTDLGSQNGWTTQTGSMRVNWQDRGYMINTLPGISGGATNFVVPQASAITMATKALPMSIAAGTTGTLFFRASNPFCWDTTASVALSTGAVSSLLNTNAAAEFATGEASGYAKWFDGNDPTGHPAQVWTITNTGMASKTWYDYWMVVNNAGGANGKVSLYQRLSSDPNGTVTALFTNQIFMNNTSAALTTLSLGFGQVRNGYGEGLQITDIYMDNSGDLKGVTPTTAPEPATMGLLAIGGLAAIVRRRRA